MPMISLWEILVPTTMPNGKPVRTKQHREWDRRVRRISKGLMVLQPTKGQWIAPDNKLLTERMIPVRIACTRSQIEDIVNLTAVFYEQWAVMYYCISNEVYIKEFPCPRPR